MRWNASGKQVENEWQWKKKKENMNPSNKVLVSTYDIYSIKSVSRKFRVVIMQLQRQRNLLYKKFAARAKISVC